MGRIRYIKPEFFTDSDLGDLPATARILFAGLWTLADRDGRLEDKPRDIRVQVLPHDDTDRSAPLTDELLDVLHSAGLITRYVIDGAGYIAIPSWSRHQKAYNKEPDSVIPSPSDERATAKLAPSLPLATLTERKGKGKEQGRSMPPNGGGLSAVESADLFDEFWSAYPRKVAKQDAETVFRGLPKADQRSVIRAACTRRSYDRTAQTPKDKIPHPATFLRRGRWRDWVGGLPDGYEMGAPALVESHRDSEQCPNDGAYMTYDEDGNEHCPLCGWEPKGQVA